VSEDIEKKPEEPVVVSRLRRPKVYPGQRGDFGVSLWFRNREEAEDFAAWATERLRKPPQSEPAP
jgi:hypothetical protein